MVVIFVSILSLLVPVAHAAYPTYARDIVIPPIEKHALATLSLPPDVREPRIETLIVSSANAAIRHDRVATEHDISSVATIVSGPSAASTLPATRIEAMMDGDRLTWFQPTTAKQQTFLLSFSRIATPTRLRIDLQSGTISEIRVRTGLSAETLRDAHTGTTAATNIPLSGETMQFMEITINVGGGVLSIKELSIHEPISTITFRAAPNSTYTLYYGRGIRTPFVQETTLPISLAVNATLGERHETELTDDFDGIPASQDNCGGTWNPGQEDADKDGIGNACDNCSMILNERQEDTNGNGIGDLCDDDDRDSIQNSLDNCPTKSNRYQEDEDKDGIGNLCDSEDSRFSANKPWILWLVIGMIVVGLSGISAMVFRRTTE